MSIPLQTAAETPPTSIATDSDDNLADDDEYEVEPPVERVVPTEIQRLASAEHRINDFDSMQAKSQSKGARGNLPEPKPDTLSSSTLTELIFLTVIVLALNTALWQTVRAIPTLKDQINWLALAAAVLFGMGVVGVMLYRSFNEDEKQVGRVGLGVVGLFNAALLAGVFYWQETTDRRAPEIPKAKFQVSDDSSAGTHIGYLKVEAGNPGKLRYEIIKDGHDGSHNFKLNPSSGELTLTRTDASDMGPMYQLHVKVIDEFHETGDGYVWIEVLDKNNPPKLVNIPLQFNNYTRSDMIIGFVRAIDPDSDRLKYRISGGNDLGLFELHEITGDLTVAERAVRPRRTTTFELEIEVSDGIAPPVKGKVPIAYSYHDIKIRKPN